jgi:outer membrane lipoprotein-sorting protein
MAAACYSSPVTSPSQKKTSSPPSAESLYQKNLDSDARYSYSGRKFDTTWLDDGRSMTTVTRVSHLAPDDFRFVYTAPARRRGSIVLQAGHDQWTYVPRTNHLFHAALPPIPSSKAAAAKFSLLKANYRLVVSPLPTRIAGRKVYEVTMLPRVASRPRQRFWIDPYTGVWLRSEETRSDGSYVFVTYYSEIDFHPKFPPLFFSASSLKRIGTRVVEARAERHVAPQAHLPPAKIKTALNGAAIVPSRLGRYVLQSATVLGGSSNPTVQIHYSDGLKTVSLSEATRTSKLPTVVPGSHAVIFSRGQIGRGTRSHGFNLLSWDAGALNLTLVGDVSLRTLAAFARQVQATKPH